MLLCSAVQPIMQHTSAPDPTLGACVCAVLAGHSKGDLARALFEGICFGHRRHVQRLESAGSAISEVVLTGGGSRSKVWAQM